MILLEYGDLVNNRQVLKNMFYGYEFLNSYFLLDGGDVLYGIINLCIIGFVLFKIVLILVYFYDFVNRYINIYFYIFIQKDIFVVVEKVLGWLFQIYYVNSIELYVDVMYCF